MEIQITNPLSGLDEGISWPTLRKKLNSILAPSKSEKVRKAEARIYAASEGDVIGAPIPQWARDADNEAQGAYEGWRSIGRRLISRCVFFAWNGSDRATIIVERQRVSPYTGETAARICISRAVIAGRNLGPTPWADIDECEIAGGRDYAMVCEAIAKYREIERYFA